MSKFNHLWLLLLFSVSCANPFGDETNITDEFVENDSSDSETEQNTTPVAVQIVTAAGGAGTEITTQTLNDGATLSLFAVSVNSDGEYLADVEVSWSVANSLGSLSVASGTSTVFTPNRGAGTETITADHATLTDDTTGNLSVTYTVTSLSDLELWLKADGDITYDGSNRVSAWTDHSGNSKDASQGGADSIKPIFVSSGINSLPVLQFDGTDDFMETASVLDGTGARTIFIAAENNANTGTYDALFDLSQSVPGSGSNFGITTEMAVRISGNRIFNEPFSAGTANVMTITNPASTNSGGIEVYLGGVQATQLSVSTQTINTTNDNTYIGRAAFNDSFCACDIAEIIVFSAELSTTDRQAVESYLSDKYNF